MDDFEMKLNQKIEELSLRCDKQDEELAKLRDEVMSKLASFEYIWKVENFTNLQAEAKSSKQAYVYSEPFFSSASGYKLRLQLNPNGDGAAKGSHLSIYLQVMQGPNDAILNWPIEYSGKISVLDQSKHKDHHSEELSQELTKFKENYNRPMAAEPNAGLGFPNFMPFDKLKPVYLTDDTIFIKLDLTIKT